MQDSDEISVVRRWISEQKVKLVNEVHALHAKIKLFDDMEKELSKTTKVKQALPSPPVVSTKQPVWAIGENAKDETLMALQAAGQAGLSAKEFAAVAHIPTGTASARLSIVKSLGLARHKQPKYFAVHSTQEDNNIPQGDELQ